VMSGRMSVLLQMSDRKAAGLRSWQIRHQLLPGRRYGYTNT
jgi:hypothetical protein